MIDDCRECPSSSFRNGGKFTRPQCWERERPRKLTPQPKMVLGRMVGARFPPPHWCPVRGMELGELISATAQTSELEP